jgi:hypothetical protein
MHWKKNSFATLQWHVNVQWDAAKEFFFQCILTTVCLGFWYYILLSLSSLSSTPIAAYSSIHTFSCNAKLISVCRLLVGGDDESAHFVTKCMLKNNLNFKTRTERMKKTVYITCFQNSIHHGNALSRICQAMVYNIYMIKAFCRVHAGDWVTGNWECVLSSQGFFMVDCVCEIFWQQNYCHLFPLATLRPETGGRLQSLAVFCDLSDRRQPPQWLEVTYSMQNSLVI